MRELSPEKFKEWNEQMANLYHPKHSHESSNLLIRYVNRKRREAIRRLLAVKPGDHVIEIGCGAGHVLAEIPCGNLTGVDLSQALLEDAKKLLAGRDARLWEGSAENLPPEIKREKFDKIYCTEVIEHVQNPDRALREMALIAHPESVIVITVPNERLVNRYIRANLRRCAFLGRIPFIGRFFRGLMGTPDEWHIHEFDLPTLLGMAKPYFIAQRIIQVPWFFPVSYAVSFRLRR